MTLEETVHQLAPGLLRFCSGLDSDRASAEDAAQESLAALVTRWRRHGPPDDPAAFTYTIARRRIRRLQFKRRLLAPLSALGEPAAPLPADHGVESRQRLASVRSLLGRLTSRERDALLVSLDGLSTHQAATVLGLKDSTYKMRLHRARRRLVALLEATDDPT